MLDANNNIVHSDLNAVTGPGRGNFPAGTYRPNPVEPDRNQPFREFTVVYHDEIKAVQAFPQFEETNPDGTPNPLASRCTASATHSRSTTAPRASAPRFLPTGSESDRWGNARNVCLKSFSCRHGPSATRRRIVDVPANTTNSSECSLPGPKATQVFFPDDSSNVHHAYLNDNVKMRVMHAGPKEHHIHHLHAHQWLHTPESDNSTYLDSQSQGPAYSFTTEIAHGGAGNRNKTPGDAIFHCHFYPHFAMGMWELFRVHDVFEAGNKTRHCGSTDSDTRKLPDGEIAAGTPIPAVVPIPTIAMPLMPTASFQGYPFFIPARRSPAAYTSARYD